jgi:predicted HicB family RNase H-like nuclease
MSEDNSARLHVRMPKELKDQAEKYAERNHTTLSAIVIRFLNNLVQTDEKQRQSVDAEQV